MIPKGTLSLKAGLLAVPHAALQKRKTKRQKCSHRPVIPATCETEAGL